MVEWRKDGCVDGRGDAAGLVYHENERTCLVLLDDRMGLRRMKRSMHQPWERMASL